MYCSKWFFLGCYDTTKFVLRWTKYFTTYVCVLQNLFFSASLCLCFVHSYTVPSNGNTVFPTQKEGPLDSNSFIRLHNSETKVLKCPPGFLFSSRKMKCVATFGTVSRMNQRFNIRSDVCPSDFRGSLPNPFNCRTFYSCWDGFGYELNCNDHLLYNERIFGCAWPESAGCCEYWEKNSAQIVQSSWNKFFCCDGWCDWSFIYCFLCNDIIKYIFLFFLFCSLSFARLQSASFF